MTLSFLQHINGEPTYFPEKIWSGLRHLEVGSELANYLRSRYSCEKSILDFEPKLHTIRKDEKDRWKVGAKIHMVINNRTKDRLQFAPVLEVKSMQKIKIARSVKGNHTEVAVYIDDKQFGTATFLADSPMSYSDELRVLAFNDGFDALNSTLKLSFFQWFSEDFEGKIIHWTELKY